MAIIREGRSHLFVWLMLAFALLLSVGVFLLIVGLYGAPIDYLATVRL